MKSLKTVQVLFKIAKVISQIVFVCCVVGFCLCVVGIVSLALGAPVLKLGGVTIESFLADHTGLSNGTLYASLAAGAIVCIGMGVTAKFAVRYFKREQADGTPFTQDGAKELQRIGILSICLPLGAQILAQILHEILAAVLPDVGPLDMDFVGSVSLGIMLIVTAQICRYGADLATAKEKPAAVEEPAVMEAPAATEETEV